MREILLTSAVMKAADAFNIRELGRTSLGLQEQAAARVAEAVPENLEKILVLAGSGNNGADGLAAARLLARTAEGSPRRTITVVECLPEGRKTEEYQIQKARLEGTGVRLIRPEEFLSEPDETWQESCILDAIFGVGLTRPVTGQVAQLIEKADSLKRCYRIAVDAPSGVSCDTGEILGAAMHCDLTVTFGWNKIGLVADPGAEYAGTVVVADIGFAEDTLERIGLEGCGFALKGDGELPARRNRSNKGSYGKLLIVAGSRNMAGAAYFSAAAAYASGTGLVRVLTPEENRVILQTLVPEAVLSVYEADSMESVAGQVSAGLNWADHIVLGPGLGTSEVAEYLAGETIRRHQVPLLVDADGLNLLAAHPDWMQYFTREDILTPHFGELSRLLGISIREIAACPLRHAQMLAARSGAVALIKDAHTLIAGPEGSLAVNAYSGNNGMSTAGSGDVLTGIIGGFMAGGMTGFDAAVNGAYLHGLSGNLGRDHYSEYALTAGRMLAAYREITEAIS